MRLASRIAKHVAVFEIRDEVRLNTWVPAPCDEAVALASRGNASAHPRLIIAATMMASSLAFIDGSVTNVALPAIGKDFAARPGELAWIINAYLLPLSALLLLGGALGDRFGRRRSMIAGIALFAAASVSCALAPTLDLLLASRCVQGVGAALLMPNSLGILGSSFEGEQRGRAVGTWAAAGAIASAVGPPLGGWLVDTVGWRAIFYLNLPVAAAAIVIAHRFVGESEQGSEPLDWRGALLATSALGCLTWALTLWSSGYTSSNWTFIGLGSGTLLSIVFLITQKRLGDRAMMPLSLFASLPFVGLSALTFLLYGALGGLLVLLPFLLIVGGDYSPVEAGFALLPLSIVIGTASRITGRLAETLGPRLPLTAGPVITGLGFALMVRADPASYWTSVLPALLIIAGGMALAVAPLTTAVLSAVDARHTGTASGLNSAVARTGGLIATALATAVLAAAGPQLPHAFHLAALCAAALAIISGAIAFVTLESRANTGP